MHVAVLSEGGFAGAGAAAAAVTAVDAVAAAAASRTRPRRQEEGVVVVEVVVEVVVVLLETTIVLHHKKFISIGSIAIAVVGVGMDGWVAVNDQPISGSNRSSYLGDRFERRLHLRNAAH